MVDKKEGSDITIGDLEKKFEESVDLTIDARQWSEKCRDYYDGNQYSAKQLEILKKRGQPAIVNNRIAPMVDFLLGIELRSRTDPKAFPRTDSPQAEQDAASATDAIRFVCDNNFFDNLASTTFETFLLEGPGGIAVEVEKVGGKTEIVLRRLAFNRLFIDPYSQEKQFNDSHYEGVVSWMDISTVVDRWDLSSKQEEEIRSMSEAAGSVARTTETYDDVPRWFDRHNRERVMVVEMYFNHKGKVWHAIFVKDTWLVEPEVSKYKSADSDGLRESPFIIACPKIARDGSHYSPTKNKLSIQDDINNRNSRSTDLLNRRQTFAKEGAIQDVRKFKQEANSSGGHIEFPAGPGEFGKDYGFVPNEQLGITEHNMYQDAIQQIESLARAGIAADNETNMSGKAIGKLQTSRNLEIQPLIEVYTMWKIRVYRAIWSRIKQFWKEERWISVTDDEESARFVGLNRPPNLREVVMEEFGQIPAPLMNDPRLDQPVQPNGPGDIRSKVSEIDVDIFIEEVPDITSLNEETFEILSTLFQAAPDRVPFDLIIRTSPLRPKIKREFLEPEATPESIQAQQEEKAQRDEAINIAKEAEIAKIRKDSSQTAKNVGEAQQTQIENRILEQFPIKPTSISI